MKKREWQRWRRKRREETEMAIGLGKEGWVLVQAMTGGCWK